MTMESAKSAAQAGPSAPSAPPAGDPARRAGDPAPPAGASEPAAPPREAHAGGSEARTELAGVLFDMDGLLVDSEPLWFEVECGVAARLDGNWSETDQQALIGGSLPRTVSYLLDRAAKPASREEVARWLVEGMTALLASRELTTMPGA